MTGSNFRTLFDGLDKPLERYRAAPRPYINFDNAASTPAMAAVQKAISDFLPFYSSVHRGTGFKSQLSTHLYEQARRDVLQFLGADPQVDTCIFGKNTTEAINKLAHRYPFPPGRDVVITTGMEHHSNDLPWRAVARTVHVALTPDGRLDEEDFDRQLRAHAGRLALVAVTGASNVTGYINPIHRLAEKAHAAGAEFLADCAQLAPHRAINMGSPDDPQRLDYVAISAHKMYAPFGTGALVGRRAAFESGDPDQRGGGTVEIVTLEDVIWSEPPEREEAGSPNTVGAVALSAAIQQLTKIGMEHVAAHEADLTRYALQRLPEVPGIRIFGDLDPGSADSRLGVIPFALEGVSHFKAAAILGYEFGTGVRSGCFCAHPYILHLLGLSQAEAQAVRELMIAGDKREMPGLIRASFGLYNTTEEVDLLVEALSCIARGEYKGDYVQEMASGEYHLEDWSPNFENLIG